MFAMPDLESELSHLHYEMIKGLIEEGVCPGNAVLAERMGVSRAHVETLLHALSEAHGVVLHPHVCEPWIVHPFSLTPTINWIAASNSGWWAPCVWCALGVATLARGEISIHTRLEAETEPLVIRVKDARLAVDDGIWVHFAIPPARAWANVHQHCALVLPFRSRDRVARWCGRHGVEQGEIVPLRQVADLARVWYGRHADRDWRKWTVLEAQEIFDHAGLRSAFWDLGSKAGRF